MPYKNGADRREASRRHYKKHRDSVIAAVKARKKSNREWWQEFKKTLVCWHCGETEPDCIDLHHVIVDKKDKQDISARWVTHRGLSRKSVLKELEKCVPLCATCHRKVHAEHRRMLREAGLEAKPD